jgi:RNA polymerase sigma-70 factor (ECF subfamily)
MGRGLVVERSEEDTGGVVPLRSSFEAFYLREFPAMVTLAYAVSRSRSGAEDLAQEAMVRAHRNWDRISTYDKPGAWVRRVTYNLAVSALRRTAAEVRARIRLGGNQPLPEPDEGPDQRVWQAVRKLPARQRAAVVLYYLEEMTMREIAGVLGCSEATAKAHVHKARRNLAATLDDQEERR